MGVSGCVYYNGMYNANRLAGSARKAEREGRTLEANNLWGQVATKAESVVVRHPRSKYAEEAAILRGLALARLGQCEQALSPLSRIAVARVETDLREDALLATGRCHVGIGNMTAADAAFQEVQESQDTWRRREARYFRARTLRSAARYEEALSVLDGVHEPRAVPERLLALAGAGRITEAMDLADSLVARGDTTQPWDSLIVALGRQDPGNASNLVDRLRRLPGRSQEAQARWLLDDGLRLVQLDTARGAARLRQAVKIGGTGDAAGRASLNLVRMDLRRAAEPQDLAAPIQALQSLAQRNQVVASEVNQLLATAAAVLAAWDSATPGATQGDIRLFLAGESARDSLLAPGLAERIFRRILDEWPDSPYAPKAVFAAQQLNPAWADSARGLLETRYLDSPYLAVTRGEEGPAYRQLEDSLAGFAAASMPARRARPGAPRRPPSATRDDDDAPGRRRPQPAPTVRVIEP